MYAWNGYEYESEDGQTWASPLEEIAAVTDLTQGAVEARLTEQGYTVEEVVFSDDRSEGYPVKALILEASADRAEMQHEFNSVLDSLRQALSN